MSTKILFNNFFFQSIGQFGARIIGYAFFLFAANFLGTSEYGLFSLVMSIGYLVLPVMDFGLDKLIVMFVSQNKKDDFFSLVNTKLITVLIGFLIVLTIVIFSKAEIRLPLLLFGIGISFQSLLNLIFGYYRGIEKMHWEAIGLLGQRVLLVLFGLFFVIIWNSAIGACSALALSLSLAFIVMYRILERELNTSIFTLQRFFSKIRTDIIKIALPLAFVDLLWGIYYRIDTVIIAQFCSMDDTGIYNGAYKLVEGFMLIGSVIMISSFPRFARLAKHNINNYINEFNKIGILLLLLSVCVIISTVFFGDLLVKMILGVQYNDSIKILYILSLSIAAIYPGYLISYSMIAFGLQKQYMLGLLFGALTNVLLNLFLIPKYNIIGAAWSKVISTFFISIVCGIFLFDHMKNLKIKKVI